MIVCKCMQTTTTTKTWINKRKETRTAFIHTANTKFKLNTETSKIHQQQRIAVKFVLSIDWAYYLRLLFHVTRSSMHSPESYTRYVRWINCLTQDIVSGVWLVCHRTALQLFCRLAGKEKKESSLTWKRSSVLYAYCKRIFFKM